jgi:Predicted membrane protein
VNIISLPALGAVCALASAFTWAVTSLLVRTVSPPLSSVTVSAVRSLLGGGLLLTWVLATGGVGRLIAIGEKNFFLLAISIVVAIALGDVMFFESARFLGLARAMTVSMVYPLMSAGFAALFLGEPLSARVTAGAVVTLTGLAVIVRARNGERVREEHWAGGSRRPSSPRWRGPHRSSSSSPPWGASTPSPPRPCACPWPPSCSSPRRGAGERPARS